MYVIVGSCALLTSGYSVEPNDFDVWVTEDDSSRFSWVDKLDKVVMPEEIIKLVVTASDKVATASPDAIYTILCSHFGWDSGKNTLSPFGGGIQWDKYKQRLLMLRSKGCKLLPELYVKLVEYWKQEFGNKGYLSLKKNKDEFFNDFVNYQYDHDLLHEIVAQPEQPMYNKCLKDNEDVLTSYDKFVTMSLEEQIQMFKEEIGVISLERWIIPAMGKGKEYSYHKAWIMSLKKTITHLTKNWATEFLVFNLEHFLKPDYKMLNNFINYRGENEMSKVNSNGVDLEFFEKKAKEMGEDLSEFIFQCCEGDLYFGSDYVYKNPYPHYSLRKEDEAEYDKLNTLYQKERNNEHQAYVDKCKEQFGGYEHLEQDGGGEGGSEYCYGVFKLGDKVYKAEYSYYSHQGHECSGIEHSLREVVPKEKTITVYE